MVSPTKACFPSQHPSLHRWRLALCPVGLDKEMIGLLDCQGLEQRARAPSIDSYQHRTLWGSSIQRGRECSQ